MKNVILSLIALLTLTSCQSFLDPQPKIVEEKHSARITYYTVGEDKWGSLTADPNTPRAKEGICVAAHPDFPFGTKLHIPSLTNKVGDGNFIVQDRGSAVTKKKAAKGKGYVFDVFVSNKYKMRTHARNRPMFMDVYVLQDDDAYTRPVRNPLAEKARSYYTKWIKGPWDIRRNNRKQNEDS